MPAYLLAKQIKKARRTSGNITLNSANWANVDTGLDLTLSNVSTGDQLVAGLTAFSSNEAVTAYLDAVTLVSSTPTNSFGKAGAVETTPGVTGVQSWLLINGVYTSVGAPALYTVVSGDIVSGGVTVRLRYATATASNKTLYASTNNPFEWFVMNLGQLDGT